MSSNRRKGLLAGLAVAVAATAAVWAGTGSGAPTTADRPAASTDKPLNSLSFVYASAADSIGIFKTVGDGIVKDSKTLGIKMKRYDNNLDGPTALRNANLMVQEIGRAHV